MGLDFTPEQYKLIFTAVRRYQIDKCLHDGKEYHECNDILNVLFPYAYTQRQEQST